jgi:hypothetical protein
MGVRVAFLDTAPASGGATPGSAVPTTAASAPRVIVPAAAVSVSGSSGTLYVVHDGHVEQRSVHIGQLRGQDLEVLSGVSAGEQVALGDLAKLSDGAVVRVEP